MQSQSPKTRKRYSPEVRRNMILDKTANIVANEGIAQLSMERIGQEVGVSKALIYNYFENVTALLTELLDRELKSLRRLQIAAAEKAETYEELVRGVTHEYLKYIDRRGLIIERLQSEPSLSKHSDPTGYGRQGAVDYFANIVSKHFDMPLDIARAASDISFGLPAAAGGFLLRSDMSRQEVEDLTVSMIIGTIVSARNDYLTRQQKLKR